MLDRDHLGVLDVERASATPSAARRARFEPDLELASSRASRSEPSSSARPGSSEHWEEVEVLAEVDGHPVAVRQGNVLAVAFHPELTGDRRLHEWLVGSAAATNGGGRMRDHRAEALAQILVRYSTRVQAGRRLRDPVHDDRRAARPGRLRGGPARRRPADHAARDRGRRAGVLRARLSDEQLDWIPPTADVGGRERRRAHRDHGRRKPARALAGRPEEAGARPEGAQAADGDLDAARRRGRATAGR